MINARLEQSRKLEAVGTLAAGIAHDFNNILGSIVGFAEMTGDDLPDGSAGKQNIHQILTASFRARDLVARMLAFARQSPVKPVHVDVVAEVREALALLRASLSPGVKLCFESNLAQATVLADPIQIQQIIMNLCINAADAMNECGTIVIRIDSVWTDSALDSEATSQICLTVTDTGSGMTPEVMERVFDPFFTTKAPNKGSGLGLSVVYGIVTQLQGVIEVKSRASGTGTGTEFKVLLPLLAFEQAGKKERYEEEHGSHISD
jgi:signal transduction histidine kinase